MLSQSKRQAGAIQGAEPAWSTCGLAEPLVIGRPQRQSRGGAMTRRTRWFRIYENLVDDPKVQRLDPSLFKALINLWCLTSANGGVLPPIDEIAFKLRMKSQKAQCILDALKVAGLFEDDEKGTHPHNWDGRQYKSDVEDSTAAERMRRYRNKQRNGSVTRPVTLRSSETETDTEAEKARNPSQGRTNSTDEAPARANGRGCPS